VVELAPRAARVGVERERAPDGEEAPDIAEELLLLEHTLRTLRVTLAVEVSGSRR
jgi:hypothetical protein